MSDARLLKKDLFGEVWLRPSAAEPSILRDTRSARWWVRWLARLLLRREARGLAALDGLDGVPALIHYDKDRLTRSYLAGVPMHMGKPSDNSYFLNAARLLRRMHRAGVAHNDLAKEPNLLVRDDGSAAFIDFQLAWHSQNRGRLFRMAAREDIRHLLKHKRTYCPDDLTQRERRMLDNPSGLSRAWMGLFKPVYLFVTRKIFGWSDREGAGDRGQQT
ncbi:MAG: serine/threonine protein kinase [Gammaproteobacteria bacterium]|nr:serine/threonine protein kinase [Gammaproteobacteria bacterium]MBU2675926.1 serine/threonine protein kinase [Gammaproteobacteria bacterium]NNC56725.1 serine/threonine protein kinase [Woeseiaceae bacterium]NNL49662.1 serine/threonine protein kinase [Woeseiaceae bacterium]